MTPRRRMNRLVGKQLASRSTIYGYCVATTERQASRLGSSFSRKQRSVAGLSALHAAGGVSGLGRAGDPDWRESRGSGEMAAEGGAREDAGGPAGFAFAGVG